LSGYKNSVAPFELILCQVVKKETEIFILEKKIV